MTTNLFVRILLVADYGGNVLLGGWYDEWISTRAWRLREKSRFWAFMRKTIDTVFRLLGQENHCFWSYVSDQMHRALPPEHR